MWYVGCGRFSIIPAGFGCEVGMGYQATTEVKVISPEILMILEADLLCVTEDSIHTTVIPNLQSWNVAVSFEKTKFIRMHRKS